MRSVTPVCPTKTTRVTLRGPGDPTCDGGLGRRRHRGWPSDEFELPKDLGARLPHGVRVHVFHGLRDETVPPSHADLYAQVIPPARVHRLPGRDHQLNNDLSDLAKGRSAPTHPGPSLTCRCGSHVHIPRHTADIYCGLDWDGRRASSRGPVSRPGKRKS
jgi:hypothetical protein